MTGLTNMQVTTTYEDLESQGVMAIKPCPYLLIFILYLVTLLNPTNRTHLFLYNLFMTKGLVLHAETD